MKHFEFYCYKISVLEDNYRHQGKRKLLAEKLADKGIKDEQVLEAIAHIPRHLFLDSSFEDHAYQDKAFPIAAGQTISHPFTVAFQTELLQVKRGEKILEVGTGSGYQAAVLKYLGAKVYTIERQHKLYKKTANFLKNIGYSPKYITFGDGYKGIKAYAPYHKIIVTAGAPYIPKDLMAQLKIGGRLVIPVGEDPQIMTLLIRKDVKKFEKYTFGEFRFVPLLENKN